MQAKEKWVGKYLTYPLSDRKRQAEGGKRLKNEMARSAPDLPLVTIITVCWNSAKTIEQTFKSVRDQTYPNIEYVVVDGGSTDGTVDLLKAHEDLIDYYVSEPDDGLYHAMNKGIELAQGDHILILNSDDWYVTDTVEALVAAIGYSGCDFVSALERHVNTKGQITMLSPVMHFDHSIYLRASIHHETMLVPSHIYDQIGPYNTDYRIVGDLDLMIRLFEAGFTHYKLLKEAIFFRQTGVSSTDKATTLTDRIALLKKKFPFLEEGEIENLADRDKRTGYDLLDLAARYFDKATLVNAIHDYMLDHVDRASRGRGIHRQWQPYANELIEIIKTQRESRSPLVSVILAVYNGEKTIRACIDSVLNQTFGNIELICVNDQTPDNSQAIIDEYCSRDSRVRSITNERNIGLGATRNRGIREAKGSYIFHIDPDDTIPAKAIEALVSYATKYDSELVRGAYLREQFHHDINFKPQVVHPLGTPETLFNKTLKEIPGLLKTPEGHWAYLYRADLARRIPYPEDLKMGQDAIFLFSILPAATRITIIPDLVYNYLENANSTMNIFDLQKYIDVLEWRRRAICVLKDYGLNDLAVNLRNGIPRLNWHDRFLKFNDEAPDPDAIERLSHLLRAIYKDCGLPKMGADIPEPRREFLQMLFDKAETEGAPEEAATFEGSKGKPKVSVIVAVYNAEDTLRRCLDSVLSQSLNEIELVCVNDQTPDGSQAIIDDYARRDKRVVSVINEKNIGLGATRNRGIAIARGQYIFHLDPDDRLPPDALMKIYGHAERYGSDMTRGVYLHEQLLLGQSKLRQERKGLKEGAPHIINTSLKKSPKLLNNTEGHWSFLYRADFAKRVKYPEDLKMGQDSIFIVNALVQAQSISITDALVYHYCANPNSAMNTFNFRKFMDALEWRIRAWGVLRDAGQKNIGEHLLFRYWNPEFFERLVEKLTVEQKAEFDKKLGLALSRAGYPGQNPPGNPEVAKYFSTVLKDIAFAQANKVAKVPPLRIATLSTQDYGGAGIGSVRRVEALRRAGVQAELHVLFQKKEKPFVKKVPLNVTAPKDKTPKALRAIWSEKTVLKDRDHPGLKAREMFSKTGSMVDFRDMASVFDPVDIVHMHWVAGMFDFDHTEVLADKPVAWTLADMNAFTGGCHYSEGCTNYRKECRDCPLLGPGSTLAHEAWKRKRDAYAKIKNLHIICPSQWLADCAKESGLLGDRPVHMIPNAVPVDRFVPTNRLAARLKLGLPLNATLVAFGADSLTNRRKGGDLLAKSIAQLKAKGQAEGVHGLFFGANSLDLGIPTHKMGHISNEKHMSLIYAAADVFAFPSREDNAPLTVVEAMLSGTPVVGFPVGNVPELVRHKETGYIARYGDAADFAEGLAWALQAPQSSEALMRGVRAHVAARSHNDPEKAVQRHIKCFRDMLAEHDAGFSHEDAGVSEVAAE